MARQIGSRWKIFGAAAVACAACCAPLLLPLVMGGSGAAGAVAGGLFGVSPGEIACLALLAAMTGGVVVLAMRARSRRKAACECEASCEVGGACGDGAASSK